jgi:hypothetical protein
MRYKLPIDVITSYLGAPMKKLETIFFFLLFTFSQHCFAEDFINESEIDAVTFVPYLAIENISNDGLTIKLNDGSEWDIYYCSGVWRLVKWRWIEQAQILLWTKEDVIEIQYSNFPYLVDFTLSIYNLSRNERALVYLKQAPSIGYSTCLRLANFNETTDCVTLCDGDGTIWLKAEVDLSTIPFSSFFYQKKLPERKWKVGDVVTILREEGWLNKNSFILWNHSINDIPDLNRSE